MIAMVEGRATQRLPKRDRSAILLAGTHCDFTDRGRHLKGRFGGLSGGRFSTQWLVACSFASSPQRIGGLLSAIGIRGGGSTGYIRRNVMATQGRAKWRTPGDKRVLMSRQDGHNHHSRLRRASASVRPTASRTGPPADAARACFGFADETRKGAESFVAREGRRSTIRGAKTRGSSRHFIRSPAQTRHERLVDMEDEQCKGAPPISVRKVNVGKEAGGGTIPGRSDRAVDAAPGAGRHAPRRVEGGVVSRRGGNWKDVVKKAASKERSAASEDGHSHGHDLPGDKSAQPPLPLPAGGGWGG